MSLRNFFAGLDSLFSQKKVAEAEEYLANHLELAQNAQDINYQLAVLNEQVGYYRSLSRSTQSLAAAELAMAIISQPELAETTSAATTMLNVATALRAAGKITEALDLYKKVDKLYTKHLEPGDARRAALYNNMAQAVMANGDKKTALEYLQEALDILVISEKNFAELATNHSNIASLYMSMDDSESAEAHLKEALAIFEALGYDDAHYPAALAGMAQIVYLKGDNTKAVEYYRLALNKIEEIFGQNADYARICKNCAKVYAKQGVTSEAEKLMQKAQEVENRLKSLNSRA